MNLCFSTLGCTDYSLPEILSLCKENRISMLEIRGVGGEMNFSAIPAFEDGNLEATEKAFADAGVTPRILGSSCAFHDPAKKESVIAEGVATVKLAQKLGAVGVRVFGDKFADSQEETTQNVISGIREILEKTEDCTVKVLLEVHGDFHTVEALSPILSAFARQPRFGLIWDIAHTRKPYGENWRVFYRAVAPFVCHVHIKDAGANGLTLPGDGEIPIADIVSTLLSDGYAGAFSLEWEKKWHPELPPIEQALERFVKLMRSVK